MSTKNSTVEKVFNDINNFNFNKKEFCEEASREHRYLQEQFTMLCLKWLETCASDDYGYDGRNEYSHRVAKEVMSHLIEKRMY